MLRKQSAKSQDLVTGNLKKDASVGTKDDISKGTTNLKVSELRASRMIKN